MEIDQLLYGYLEGHRLLASSIDLEESLNWELVRTTDRPSVTEDELDQGVTFGLPLREDFYALCRTWSAREIERSGAVWSHVLLLPKEIDSPLSYLHLLHDVKQPNIEQFTTQISVIAREGDTQNSELSIEATRLLLLLSAKPRGGVRALSTSAPLEVLYSAQNYCNGLLNNQAFSTNPGKKDIEAYKNSVILTSSKNIDRFTKSWKHLLESNFQVPSTRINQAWKAINQDNQVLQEWLSIALTGIRQTTSNLKLVMEAILLGQGKLDDNKLLIRIGNAVENTANNPLLRYALGHEIGPVEAPSAWVSALYLLTEDNWNKWTPLVDAELIGKSAAKAPSTRLAGALENAAATNFVKSALHTLANTIDEEHFIALSKISEPATELLISINRELLFALPSTDRRSRNYAAMAIRQNEKDIMRDLHLLSKAPFFWKTVVAAAIRLFRFESELINFSSEIIEKGEWNNLSAPARKFLKNTPNFTEKLLETKPSKKILETTISEFGNRKVTIALTNLIRNDITNIGQITKTLIDTYGEEVHIDAINKLPKNIKNIAIASLSEERWRRSHGKAVVNRIKDDLSEVGSPLKIIGMIKNKKLSALLKSSYKDE